MCVTYVYVCVTYVYVCVCVLRMCIVCVLRMCIVCYVYACYVCSRLLPFLKKNVFLLPCLHHCFVLFVFAEGGRSVMFNTKTTVSFQLIK